MMNNNLSSIDLKLIEDIKHLPDNYWDFKDEDTRCYTHGIHGYPAVMVAPISRNLINIISKYQSIDSIMDPFMGSGSVLIESMVKNVDRIYGIDLNPLAQLLSKVRTTILTEDQLIKIEKIFSEKLNKEFEKYKNSISDFDNFIKNEKKLDITGKQNWGFNAHKYIEEYLESRNIDFNFPTFSNIGFWFQPKAIFQLQIIKNIIIQSKDKNIKDFLMITFSETVRKVSNTRNSEFKLFRIKKETILKTDIDALKDFYSILNRNIKRMREFISIKEKNNINSKVFIINGDTRNIKTIKSIPNESVDLVITSPPYGDSQTTVAYGQYSRLSLQWLDLETCKDVNIAALDKNLLGGKPYKEKSQWTFLGSETLVNSLTKISEIDPFRADDVFGFYVDLDKCIYGINSKMKKGSYQFWVVGNRTVKGINLKTDVIISEMAKKYGLEYVYTIKRNIVNKVMPSLNSPTNEAGKRVSTMTKENIIILKKLSN